MSDSVLSVGDGFIAYERYNENERIAVLANMSDGCVDYNVCGEELLSGKSYDGTVKPCSIKIVKIAE